MGKRDLTRKDFFKSAAGMAAIAGGLKGIKLTNTLSAKTLTGTRMGLLYDSSKCIGCRHCEEGCIKENNLPKERTLGKLSETSRGEGGGSDRSPQRGQ